MNATFQQYFLPLEHHASPLPDPRASMALDPGGGAFQLERRQNLTLRDALGWTVHAVTGEVWITQDWDTRDVVLEAGQSFVIDRPGAGPEGTPGVCLFDQLVSCGVITGRNPIRYRPAGDSHGKCSI